MKEKTGNTSKLKGGLAKKLIILGVAIAMVATTAISLAFWSSGISAAEQEKNLSVTIGTGKSVPTILSLDDVVNTTDALIPQNKTPDEGETTSYVFSIDVEWKADPESESGDDIDGAEGVLTGACTAIGDDWLEATGKDELPLFVVEFDEDSYEIFANGDPVTVTVTFKMNEPLDFDQYKLLEGQTLSITLEFEVTPA